MPVTPVTPIPLEIDNAGVLLVGGSFDPPHRGHVGLARAARDRSMPGAALLFVPAARSPHKAEGPKATDEQRGAMLRLAIEGVPRAGVWSDELDRAGTDAPSYWVDTLRRARSIIGDRPVRFLIGADQAAALHRWRETRALLELADPVIVLRGEIDSPDDLRSALDNASFWAASEVERLCDCTAVLPKVDVSSTEVRHLLRTNEKHARLEAMLHPGVLGFIRENGLYV
ncbi:MAG: nicotinate-nicotinamide nucleotide adenylyltransferase [Planctomycetota bacterium]